MIIFTEFVPGDDSDETPPIKRQRENNSMSSFTLTEVNSTIDHYFALKNQSLRIVALANKPNGEEKV